MEVRAHALAKPDKGSGIATICTFGDLTDVTWWCGSLDLPTRARHRDATAVSRPSSPSGIADGTPASATRRWPARPCSPRRRPWWTCCASPGTWTASRSRRCTPGLHERGDKPLRRSPPRQRHIRNGGRDASAAMRAIQRGREMAWHPSFHALPADENWIEGLNGRPISRQRFFGVPFRSGTRWDASGLDDEHPALPPSPQQLPVDPAADTTRPGLHRGAAGRARRVHGGPWTFWTRGPPPP
ncbi:hypothetical protein QJS66_01565 [Kocuria rhizophila]|nr:hypothetical protein QJS66_01565 [Kocuria rhizophila]